jgi:hypothetical protein
MAIVGLPCGTCLARNIEIASWLGPISGNWTDGARWSTAPQFPNNGFPAPTTVYAAVLSATGVPHNVSVDGDITIDQFVLASPDVTVRQPAARMRVRWALIADSGTYHVSGGTLELPTFGDFDANFGGAGGNATLRQTGGIVYHGGDESVNRLVTFGGWDAHFGLPGAGTLSVEGKSSQYLISPAVAGRALTAIGMGTGAIGNAVFRGGARADLANTAIGFFGGTGTMTIDSGAAVTATSLQVGIGQWTYPAGGSFLSGTGRVILRDPASSLRVVASVPETVGVRIGDFSDAFGGGTVQVDGGKFEVESSVMIEARGRLEISGGHVSVANVVRVRGGATLALSGGVTSTATLTVSGIQPAHALLTGGSLTFNTSTVANSGIMHVNGASVRSAGRLFIDFNGRVTFGAGTLDVGSLSVGAGRLTITSGADRTLRTTSLTIGEPDGVVDIGDNRLLIDYTATSPVADVRSMVARAHNGGAWDGDGLTSSAAAAQGGFAVGYAESTAIHTTFPGTFGEYAVDDTAVLARLTRYGDANLDGVVNLQDFNRLAANFGQADKFWHHGDFNYDGNVNLQDFNRLASNFGLSAAGPEVTSGDWAALAAVVPEPAPFLAFGVAASAAMCSRRRRRTGSPADSCASIAKAP